MPMPNASEIIEEPRARLPLPRFGLLAARQLERIEQELAELLGRSEIERSAALVLTSQLLDLGFQAGRALCELARQTREYVAVDPDAGALHLDQDRQQRALESLVDGRHAVRRQPRLQDLPESQRNVGVLGGIGRCLGNRHLGEGPLLLFVLHLRLGDHVLDLTGDVGGRLVEVDRDGNLRATNLVERICRGYQHEGLAQVIFDPWNGFSPGERFVNDAEAGLMVAGARIAQELGCNVRFTAHVSKAVGRGGIIDAHSGRGGSAMGDNARFCFTYVQHDLKEEKTYKAIPTGADLAAARGDLYRLHMTKQSYAKCLTEPIWIERQGFAFTVHDSAPTTPETLLRVDGERVLTFLRDELTRGIRYSPSALADQYRQFPLSRGRARAVIDWLQSSRQIIERPLPDMERNRKRTHYLDVVELSMTTPEGIFA